MGPITVVSIEEPLKTVQFGKERHFAVPGWLLSTLLTLSVGFVWAYLQGNTFPAMWHPDEPSKVHQIITNERDYYHPLLLLRATQLALAFTGARPTSEHVVLAGRQVSAVSAGLAVLALGIAAARLNGSLASLMVAAIVGTCPLLFGLAHYMKEDVIFVLALSVFFLSVVLFDQNNRYVNVAALGVAAGLVISTKYIGVVVIPVAITILVWKLPLRRMAVGTLILAIWSLMVFALVGIDAVEIRKVAAGLRWEVMHVASTTSHHGGFTWPITSIFYISNLLKSAPAVLLFCYVIAIYLSLSQRWSLSQIMLILFPLLFSLALQISPVKIVRYQLPVLVFCGFGAACALSSLAHGRWYMKAFVGAAFITILGFNIAGVYNTWKAITVDTRAEMANWIGMHLSPTAVLAQEGWDAIRHGVPSGPETGQVPVEVITVPRLISFGSLDGARRAGVTHILLQQAIYGCHVDPSASVSTNPSVRAFTLESRRFYQTLIREAPVVHYVPGRNPPGTFFSPALWLLCVVCDPPARPNIDVDFSSSCLT